MIDVFPFAGYPVAVFGLGRSGLTAAKSLAGSEAVLETLGRLRLPPGMTTRKRAKMPKTPACRWSIYISATGTSTPL